MNELAQTLISSALAQLDFPDTPAGLYVPIRYALEGGGKHLRACLTLETARLLHGDEKVALRAAMAVELYHNHTLVHDDVMDRSPLRRGRPSVFARWGSNAAILSGDAMLIRAFRLVDDLPEALALLARTAEEVCQGQQLDVDFEGRNDVEPEEYMEMIRLKTSVLLGCALQMGGVAAGADEGTQALLHSIGQQMGFGFQLQDDLLDLFGEETTLGKPIGGDVFNGKKTLLHIIAMRNASPESRERLMSLAGNEIVSRQELIETARAIMIETEAAALCREKMNDCYTRAEEGIGRLAARMGRNCASLAAILNGIRVRQL